MKSDLVIVGGGPAGLATAIFASLRGFEVLVLDRAEPPIDKVCGEGLMPGGLAALKHMGVSIDPEHSSPIRGIRYWDGDQMLEGAFSHGEGLGYRRLALQEEMFKRARALGVQFVWKVAVTGLENTTVLTEAGRYEGRWVIGADGLYSQVRKWMNVEIPSSRERRTGLRRHYPVCPWSDFVEIYWGTVCEAYVTPVGPRTVCVVLMKGNETASFDQLLEALPRLKDRLGYVPPLTREKAWGPMDQRVSRVWQDRIALVGDAAGYRDSITGEGLSLAFREAQVLVEAISEHDLAQYARWHRQLVRLPYAMISFVLFLKNHPRLRHRFMRAFGQHAALFQKVLAVHDGFKPLGSFGYGEALAFVASLACG